MRFQGLDDWLAWQETLHRAEIELGLARVSKVLSALGRTQFDCPLVSVAGTNGKGSSVAMMESVYLAAGYRVGTYTSPHLLAYNERVRLNGEMVTDAQLCEAFERIDQARAGTSLTYFEFGTLAAIEIFADSALDVVIMEVGMGGRLDAVNVLDADVALITPVDLDHGAWLGEDREQIGREKAGIMRSGRPVVCADDNPPASLQQTADQLGAVFYLAGRDFSCVDQAGQWRWQSDSRVRDALPEPALRGVFQKANAAAVLMVIELLSETLPVSQSHLREGLAAVSVPGRFQVIAGAVPMILDVAHNPQAARALATTLAGWSMPGQSYAITAVMADKDIEAIFAPLGEVIDDWYLTSVDAPRAAKAGQLAEYLSRAVPGAKYTLCDTVAAALRALEQRVQPNDRIVVFGSFYTVAAALQADYNADQS